MASIFSSTPGQVVIVRTKTDSGTPVIVVTGATFDKAIIVGMHTRLETDVSYMRSLSDNFYVFPFGDKPSDLELDLLIISEACEGNEQTDKIDLNTGLKSIVDYYKANRVQFAKATIINIHIGESLHLQGLLTSMEIIGAVEAQAPVVRARLFLKAWLIT